MSFEEFPKIARLSRNCVITEKIDGTNAQVFVADAMSAADAPWLGEFVVDGCTYRIAAGSRTRWITPEADNFGFAAWVKAHAVELAQLGPGRHFGEWWGAGIQRGYGLPKGEKRFSLFNTNRWGAFRDRDKFPQDRPDCCSVVPVIFSGLFSTGEAEDAIAYLRERGSVAAHGFMNPEGIVIYHEASRTLFKKTLEKDSEPKSKVA